MTLVALLAALLFGSGGSQAAAYEPFPEFENPSEVPVFGKIAPKETRTGPPPPVSLVRLATYYVKIANYASNVRCHGIRGDLISCRLHISTGESAIAARVTVEPSGRYRDFISRCETLRLLRGRLSEFPCYGFAFDFDKWQQGPPDL